MNAGRLSRFLRRHARIGLDTSPFIYDTEDHPRYAGAAHAVFTRIAAGHSIGVTSTLTMTELLVMPFRSGRPDAADEMFSTAIQVPNIEWLSPSLGIAERAARARATYQLRTLDAIQLATALTAGAKGFVTNDKDFRRVTDIDVLMLDDLL